jgi:hypothetical protein
MSDTGSVGTGAHAVQTNKILASVHVAEQIFLRHRRRCGRSKSKYSGVSSAGWELLHVNKIRAGGERIDEREWSGRWTCRPAKSRVPRRNRQTCSPRREIKRLFAGPAPSLLILCSSHAKWSSCGWPLLAFHQISTILTVLSVSVSNCCGYKIYILNLSCSFPSSVINGHRYITYKGS